MSHEFSSEARRLDPTSFLPWWKKNKGRIIGPAWSKACGIGAIIKIERLKKMACSNLKTYILHEAVWLYDIKVLVIACLNVNLTLHHSTVVGKFIS